MSVAYKKKNNTILTASCSNFHYTLPIQNMNVCMCCEGIKIVCYLEYSISDRFHTVPAETTTGASDAGGAEPAAVEREHRAGQLFACSTFLTLYFIYYMTQGVMEVVPVKFTRVSQTEEDHRGSKRSQQHPQVCTPLTINGAVLRREQRQKLALPAPRFQRSINEVSRAASAPSYRCGTCRR